MGSVSIGVYVKGGSLSRDLCRDTPPPGTRKAAGTHLTGMVSCLLD